MPYTKTDIANLMLGHLGIGESIGNADTENSAEAIQFRRFFEHCRGLLLEMRPWSFVTRRVALQDIGISATSYKDQWAYRYMYPNDARRINEIINPAQRHPQSETDKIKYRIVDETNNSKAILTDQQNAICEYNYDATDPAVFDSTFAQALSLMIAMSAGPALRVNANIQQMVDQKYEAWKAEASINDLSQAEPDNYPPSEFQQFRA